MEEIVNSWSLNSESTQIVQGEKHTTAHEKMSAEMEESKMTETEYCPTKEKQKSVKLSYHVQGDQERNHKKYGNKGSFCSVGRHLSDRQ